LQTFDYVIIGSGFGGSVSAMRLTEKGYSVLVLERGKRFRDQDFAKTNWAFWKFLWLPGLRSFGIMQISPFRNVFVLHGSGVGGGSLVYANVLMEPSDQMFANPLWCHLADWKTILKPHYETAKRILGVTTNPCLWPADFALKQISAEYGFEKTFQPTTVGVFFGEPGKEAPDPYFGGDGPARTGCIQCGGCMVGCRYNAKNTLVKNYLFFAEKWGAQVWAECEVRDIRPLSGSQPDGARYEVIYRSSTRWLKKPEKIIRARNVVLSGGSLGTQRLLFRCRDLTKSLPNISDKLGTMVRTNSEALLGVSSRDHQVNYSEGIAITSIVQVDEVTAIEPVRYSAGSSLMRLMAGPLSGSGTNWYTRLLASLRVIFEHPVDFVRQVVGRKWAERTTILLVMQTEDNRIRMKLGRSLLTGGTTNCVSCPDESQTIPTKIDIGHQVTRRFAEKVNGIPQGSINESLLNIPMTAHILGGCPFGKNEEEGVIGLDCQIHNYPGIFVVDGSIMPANPGINPSLSIAALAEYAMSQIPPKPGAETKVPLGVFEPSKPSMRV
jgi:cholesterol oxidase